MNRHAFTSLLLSIVASCGTSSSAEPPPATKTEPTAARKAKPAAQPAVAKVTPVTSPGAAPDDWAPSTGREMPRAAKPTQDRAALGKQLAAGYQIGRAAKDKATCNRAITMMYPAAVALALVPTKKTAPVFETLARCARKAKRYQVLEVVARATATTTLGRTSDLATALIGQDRREDAARELATRLATTPDDPFLLVARARLSCLERDYVACRAAGERAVAKSKGEDPELIAARAQGHVAIWHGALMLGDYPAARAAVAGVPEGAGRELMTKELVPAERTKLAVHMIATDTLPLGVYHLAGSVNPAPLELTFGNAEKRERELRVEVEIPGVSTKMVKTVIVLGNKAERITMTPPLLPSFGIAQIRAPRRAQLDVKVTEGTTIIYERSLTTDLLPRDYLPTWHKTSEDSKRPTIHNAGAWVTPNDPAVETFLSSAKQRLVGKQAFSGPQSATLPQVQALYDELKARGVSYVMDPMVGSDQFIGQRTRLPSEVLASTNAQCLESTLLFASLLEALGLEPLIVTVPGHAFVGWKPSSYDGKVPPVVFLETTMVHTASFESAVKVAVSRVEAEHKRGAFKSGASQLISVKALRARGITPQP